ncbi:quercetin 2,3-dioxygenase [Nostoc sp.]|uniref:quercetin 2,3-dioxygenase n=1 Tax=Nostoc sp. TaxID=1180 RepID=UPI002FF756B1
MNSQNKPQAFEVNNAEGRAYWGMGILWIMLATAEDTNGAYSCIEELIPHGLAAPPHIHEAADETFYIMEGEATFFVEDQPIQATAGSFVSIPRGTKHAFQVDSEIVRLINTYVPAGFEYMIIETAEPAKARTLPPASIPSSTIEQPLRAMEQVIQKYPAAKTNFLQGYKN